MDLLNFLSLVLFIIFGSIAGFITNRIAISHLFKNIHFFGNKIQPFKSVIARTRDELAENISAMVEEKIITPGKMQASMENNRILFDESINKILLKVEKSKDLQKSIADFDKDKQLEMALGKTTDNILMDNISCFIDTVLSGISFEELIGEETVCRILEKLIPVFISEDKFNRYLTEFFKNNPQITFKTLLGENIYNNVKENFNNITKKALDNTISNELPSITRIIENIIYESGFENNIKKSLREISVRKLNSLSGSAGNVDFNNSILKLIKDFIISDDFKNIIEDKNTFKIFYDGLMGINLHIDDILPGGFWENINNMLPGKINEIIPVIRDFIHENENIILNAIDSSLKEVIEKETSDNWFSNKTRKLAKNTIINKIWDKAGDEYKVIKKINDILEKSDIEITKQIMDFINDNFRYMTVAELVNKLAGNGKNYNKYARFIYKIIYRNINKNSDNKILMSIIDIIGNIPLSVFLLEKNIDSLYNTGKNKLIKSAGNKIMEKDTIAQISNTVTDLFDGYCNKSVYGFITGNKVHFNIEEKSICEKLVKFIISNLYNKPLEYICGKRGVRKLTTAITNKSSGIIKKLYCKNWNKKLKDILVILFGKSGLARNSLSNGIIKLLPVKKMVNDGVKEMDTDDLCNKMNDFFGRELKPLERMGIVMGAVFGGTVWAIQYHCFKLKIEDAGMLLFGFKGILPFVLSLLVFALIGIITNFFAVYFLFKPYEKKFGLEWFQGYICRDRNKKRCADGIAAFIDDNFLSRELNLKNITQDKVQFYSSNNFARLRNEVKNNKHKITGYVSGSINRTPGTISKPVATELYNYAEKNTLNTILNKTDNANGISNYFIGFLEEKSGYFAEFMAGKLPGIKLKSMFDADKVSDNLSSELLEYIETNIFNTEYIKDIFNKLDKSFDSYKNRKITDLFNESDICSLVNGLIFSEKTKELINNFINSFFETGFNQTKTLGTVFDGTFKKLIDDNIDIIFDIIISEIKLKFNNDKSLSELSHSISEGIREEQDFLEKLGGYAIGQDNLIKEALKLFFENKFDILLEENEIKIKKLLKDNIFEKIFNIKIADIINNNNKIKLDSLVNKFFEKIPDHRDSIGQIVKKAVQLLFNTASKRNIRAGDCMELFNINKPVDIYDRFATEINGIIYNTKNNFHSKNLILKDGISTLVNKIITDNYLDLEVSSFIKNTNKTEISKQLLKIFSGILESGIVNFYLSSCIKDMPVIYISSLINEKEFEEVLNRLIEYIMEDNALKQDFENTINGIIDTLCNDDYKIFANKETKEIFESLLMGLTGSIDMADIEGIMDSFEFKKIIYTSIVNLDGSEIHNLFKSFAGKYLNNLVLMGWLGAFFGIFNAVSVIVFIYYLVWLRKELDADG